MARWNEHERRSWDDRDPRRGHEDRDGRRDERGYGPWDPRQYGYGTDARPEGRQHGAEYRPRDARGREYRGEPRGWSADDQDWGHASAEHRDPYERGTRGGGEYEAGPRRWNARPEVDPALGMGTYGLGGFGLAGAGMGGLGMGAGRGDYLARGADPRFDRRSPRDDDRDDDRGLWDRSRDHVAAWFGDDDAERRLREDHRGRGPKGYTRSDARIHEDVCERLTDDPFVDASDVEITVAEGEVTLTGTVTGRAARRRAEDCAESVSGVRHVQNNLRVKGTGATTSVPGGGLTAASVPAAGGSMGPGYSRSEDGRH